MQLKPNNKEDKPDIFNRIDEIKNLTSIIENINEPLVLSIDSAWGTGKTTFVEYWQKYLDTEEVNIKNIYFNAWEHDYTEDPLIALVSTIDVWIKSQPDNSIRKEKWNKAKKLLPLIAKSSAIAAAKAITLGSLDIKKEYEDIAASLSENITSDLVSGFNTEKIAIESFKEKIKEITENKEKLIIFIDELDRCRPTYAIETLERIKHLFNTENIVFIISTDVEQLSHSVRAIYGNDFKSKRYLHRFIDITYTLKAPKMETYLNHLFSITGIEEYFDLFKNKNKATIEKERLLNCSLILSQRFNLQLRDLEQFVSRLHLILLTIKESGHIDSPLITTLVMLKNNNHQLYVEYIQNPKCTQKVIDYLSISLTKKQQDSLAFCLIQGFLLSGSADKINNYDESLVLAEKYINISSDMSLSNTERRIAKKIINIYENPRNDFGSHAGIDKAVERIELYEKLEI